VRVAQIKLPLKTPNKTPKRMPNVRRFQYRCKYGQPKRKTSLMLFIVACHSSSFREGVNAGDEEGMTNDEIRSPKEGPSQND
jgi:hypothetical protein